MADRTVPRLPKLHELTKLQALLLLGGAFVFAVLVWGFRRYDLVVDRTPAAPEDSVMAATIYGVQTEEWRGFAAKLPERARQALSNVGELDSVTLFAVPDETGKLQWGVLEALSAVSERSGRRAFRLVPKGTSAVGHITLQGRKVPFEASVTKGLFRARVGKDFRGPALSSNPFAKGRRQLAMMQQQMAYLEKPSGASWNAAVDLLSSQLQRFQPQAGIWRLPGRLELSVSASETGAVSPFVLYYRPEYGRGLDGPRLETYAKALLAESEPVGFDVTLPDDSKMVELRREPDSVQTIRKKVNQFGERAQMRIPGGTQKMEIFYADDGEAWMSDDLGLIQAAIMGSVSAAPPQGACEIEGEGGFASFSGKGLQAWPLFQGFDRLTFSIHDLESGMFTTCGYFTP